MKVCYMCKNELTGKNKSKEHIIADCLGGKLKSKGLLCEKCNSILGDKIDTVLGEQFKIFTNMLKIKGDKNQVQPIEVENEDGCKFVRQPDGIYRVKKPVLKYEKNNGQIKFYIKAGSAKKAIEKLNEIKSRYPNFDIEEYKNNIIDNKCVEMNEKLIYTFKEIGGEKFYRAITKIALNYAIEKGVDYAYLDEVIQYVISGEKNRKFVEFIYNKDKIIEKSDEIIHTIILKGNPNQRMLYCYVELFTCFKFIIVLNNNYIGKEIEYSYFYDLEEKVPKKFNYFLDLEENYFKKEFCVKTCYEYQDELCREINNVLKKIIINNEKKYIIEKNARITFGEKGINAKTIDEFVDNLLDELINRKIIQFK